MTLKKFDGSIRSRIIYPPDPPPADQVIHHLCVECGVWHKCHLKCQLCQFAVCYRCVEFLEGWGGRDGLRNKARDQLHWNHEIGQILHFDTTADAFSAVIFDVDGKQVDRPAVR